MQNRHVLSLIPTQTIKPRRDSPTQSKDPIRSVISGLPINQSVRDFHQTNQSARDSPGTNRGISLNSFRLDSLLRNRDNSCGRYSSPRRSANRWHACGQRNAINPRKTKPLQYVKGLGLGWVGCCVLAGRVLIWAGEGLREREGKERSKSKNKVL